MPIHEKTLIRPENLRVQESLEIDGVDVSGHWSTFIESRAITDYNEAIEDEVAALPGGEYIHRCWQCGSCTNSCTVNAINAEFNPRHWIYLVRIGMESELLRDKEIIWQCVSCNKCTYACPRDVNPEGVMKSLAHWLELKGHTEKSPAQHFDEVFAGQVFATGKIEEGRIIRAFFARTGQALRQDWLMVMAKRLVRHLPLKMMIAMGIGTMFQPKTRGWGRARAAIAEHIAEQKARERKALGLTD
ncbi:MAG: heterodisulfide reductase subunit C [Rhodospirillaceae bacterium]|jgi:heterodisulfide reductase subunit C2|nr:heterodisulfide reductase subunit C [Rhodospirillaceae bacterium]MBT3627211.1 heterodisulfide reductase subunit C [Rhodospirillaceae bacterium]MBT3926487.1 heterodisulfide reductase subunit C [Rhodospirillaceae bacterium]MBT4428396.1 heterodisulfide reductase subunit C [Rhodospirillaceae bacterium]MBT5039042.1 heterodisulfide reductase subunit C [Rhodospirillaceae bacterium]